MDALHLQKLTYYSVSIQIVNRHFIFQLIKWGGIHTPVLWFMYIMISDMFQWTQK